MQTESGTAGPWQGARPTETERCDSSGPLGNGKAALAITDTCGLAIEVEISTVQHANEQAVNAVLITASCQADRAASVRAEGEACPASTRPIDAIAKLIVCLTAAANTSAPMSLGHRARVTVRRVPAGFALKRSDRG